MGDKQQIASYFILSSPTGEVNAMVEDVKTLVNDEATTSREFLKGVMREYNTQQMVSATAPNGEKVLVSVHGQVSDNAYLDPASGKVLTFDHLEQKFTGETDQKQVLSENIDSFRSNIEGELKEYIKSKYRPGKCVTAVYGADNGSITVCISAKNVKLSAYWSGAWRSKFSIDVSKKGEAVLTGSIKVNVHYFEDGNVQLHSESNKQAKIQVKDSADTARAVVGAIDQIESQYQSSLEEIYVQMHSQQFKSMRRFYPVTGQPMNWYQAAHSVATEIQKKK